MSNQEIIPFDQYQRYGVAARAIERLRTDSQPLTILEVGASVQKVLGKLMPNDRIVYLDREVPECMRDQQDIIIGDATELNIPDASFDVVVALDVFEHIPAEKREDFLKHATRVARLVTIIGAPFDEPGVREAEKEVHAFWISMFGHPYRWLAEHEENGLPMLDCTKSKLDDLGLEYFVISHGELKLWTKLISAHFAKEYVNSLRPVVNEIDRYYKRDLFESDFVHSGAYRQFIFASRNSDALRKLRLWHESLVQHERAEDTQPLVNTLIANIPAIALEAAPGVNLRQTISERDRQIASLNQVISERDRQIASFIASKSWQITKPLRFIDRLLRG